MIYLQSLSDQTRVFLLSFGFGFILGIMYDIFRTIRLTFSSGKRFIFLYDVVYVTLCAVFSFLFFLAVNNGKVRGYAFFAELLGWLVYYFSLGVVAIKCSKATVRFTRRLFTLLSKPVLFLTRLIRRIVDKAARLLKKFLKKVHKKSKFHLKFNRAMVYNLRRIIAFGKNRQG